MEKEHFYEVDLKWKRGRIGELSSPSLENTITCATPPEFPKGIAGIWSPEHLFLSSLNSCFMATFLAIADNYEIAFERFDCKTRGKLSKVDGVLMISEVLIEPVVVIHNESDEEKILKALHKADRVCLISNSVKSKLTLIPKILVNINI
jgi:organic hydroperoxide reductase OsmC/OhrA